MNSATGAGLKKKKAKNADLENADAKSKQTLKVGFSFWMNEMTFID